MKGLYNYAFSTSIIMSTSQPITYIQSPTSSYILTTPLSPNVDSSSQSSNSSIIGTSLDTVSDTTNTHTFESSSLPPNLLPIATHFMQSIATLIPSNSSDNTGNNNDQSNDIGDGCISNSNDTHNHNTNKSAENDSAASNGNSNATSNRIGTSSTNAANTATNSITSDLPSVPIKRKQCHCKNSKCLKLYCECFASRAYCAGIL